MINCYIAMETHVPRHPPLVNHRACDSFTQLFSYQVLRAPSALLYAAEA